MFSDIKRRNVSRKNEIKSFTNSKFEECQLNSKWEKEDKKLLCCLFAFRALSSFTVQTSYVPDEFYQSLEVAHYTTFGYGYLTWEWREGIRSYLHPLLFAVYFKLLAVLGFDNTFMISRGSRVLQSAVAALCDLYMFNMSKQLTLLYHDFNPSKSNIHFKSLDKKNKTEPQENTSKSYAAVSRNKNETTDTITNINNNSYNNNKENRDAKTSKSSILTVICAVTSWYLFFSSTRTLINNFEILFVAMTTYYLTIFSNLLSATQKQSMRNMEKTIRPSLVKMVVIMVVSTMMRPTILINWVVVVGVVCSSGWVLTRVFIKYSVLWGLPIFIAILLIDCYMYGHFTNVLYNFFYFNFVNDISHIYGTHPLHWYITQGLPTVGGSLVLLLVPGLWLCRHQYIPVVSFLWPLIIYSLQPHKEFRFLSSIIPFIMHFSGCALHHFFFNYADMDLKSESKNSKNLFIKKASFLQKPNTKRIIFVLILTNLPLACYFNLIHQRGVIDVVSYLDKNKPFLQQNSHPPHKNSTLDDRSNQTSVLFLLPCHSTPLYSHLHIRTPLSFLTCEPNFNQSDASYIDEADLFHMNPVAWVRQQNWTQSSLSPPPKCLVMYQKTLKVLKDHLKRYNLHNVMASFFHTHLPESRTDNYLVLNCNI